jgi:hypothetical protein
MKTGQLSIALAALLAVPIHSLAQSEVTAFGGRDPKPVCVYKGVMSDAEIEVCTGFRVDYNYGVYSGRPAYLAVNRVYYVERPARIARARPKEKS